MRQDRVSASAEYSSSVACIPAPNPYRHGSPAETASPPRNPSSEDPPLSSPCPPPRPHLLSTLPAMMLTARRLLPRSPAARSRHSLGWLAGLADAAQLIRVVPTPANGTRRNGASAAGVAAGPGGCRTTLAVIHQRRNQTPAAAAASPTTPRSISSSAACSFPGIIAGAPLPPEIPVALPSNLSATKMASENGIKSTHAPGGERSSNQSHHQPATSTFTSAFVQRPAQFHHRPTQNTGTATGTSSPAASTQQKRNMVSITPSSVNRTALHPHGVQCVFQNLLGCFAFC